MQSWSAPVGLAPRAVSDAHTLLLTTGADCDGAHSEKITTMVPRPAETRIGPTERTPASSSSCPGRPARRHAWQFFPCHDEKRIVFSLLVDFRPVRAGKI